ARGALGVRYVVDGTLRVVEKDTEVTARLFDVVNNIELWAGKVQASREDLFKLQERLANAISLALDGTAAPESIAPPGRGIRDARAYDYYLRAREAMYHGLTRDQLQRALVLLRAGLKVGGESALLYSAMGTVYAEYGMLMFERAGERSLQRAEVCARKAATLDPESGEAHFLSGLVKCRRGNIKEGARGMLRAIAINPSLTDALFWGAC